MTQIKVFGTAGLDPESFAAGLIVLEAMKSQPENLGAALESHSEIDSRSLEHEDCYSCRFNDAARLRSPFDIVLYQGNTETPQSLKLDTLGRIVDQLKMVTGISPKSADLSAKNTTRH